MFCQESSISMHMVLFQEPLFFLVPQPPCPKSRLKKNLVTHVSQGTTTILSLDGFAHPGLASQVKSICPVNIKTAITHYPKAYLAARKIDASGLKGLKEEKAEEIIKRFPNIVVAIGEGGSGATLGGGIQDYKFIPEMVKRETGVAIDQYQARG